MEKQYDQCLKMMSKFSVEKTKKKQIRFNIKFNNYAVNKIEKPGTTDSSNILQMNDTVVPLGARIAMSQMATKTENHLFSKQKQLNFDIVSINSDQPVQVDSSIMKKALEDNGLKVNNSMSKILLKRLFDELEAYLFNDGELPQYCYDIQERLEG